LHLGYHTHDIISTLIDITRLRPAGIAESRNERIPRSDSTELAEVLLQGTSRATGSRNWVVGKKEDLALMVSLEPEDVEAGFVAGGRLQQLTNSSLTLNRCGSCNFFAYPLRILNEILDRSKASSARPRKLGLRPQTVRVRPSGRFLRPRPVPQNFV